MNIKKEQSRGDVFVVVEVKMLRWELDDKVVVVVVVMMIMTMDIVDNNSDKI